MHRVKYLESLQYEIFLIKHCTVEIQLNEKPLCRTLKALPINGTLANSVDPDQTPQTAASDQGLHCLH